MPKIIYTLKDVKSAVAAIEGFNEDEVSLRCSLQGVYNGEVGVEEIKNDSEIFEIERKKI